MSTERDNRMVWDHTKAGHYEVWYATFNHRPTQCGFWLRYTLESPQSGHGAPYCQLWFACFDAQAPERNIAFNRRFPIDELEHRPDPFRLRIGPATLSHGCLEGVVCEQPCRPAENVSATQRATLPPVRWDLEFAPCAFTHHHLPASAYSRDFADTRVLSPNLMTHFSGRIQVGDRIFDLEEEPGCQTHLWGRKHAHAHAWAHCSTFREEPTAALELLSVRLRRGPLVTPPLTLLSLYLGSEVYHFNDFHLLPLTRGSWETGLYRFGAVGTRVKIEGELRCRPEDLVRAPYVDPDGATLFCHNTEVADASVRVYQRRSLLGSFRPYAKLTSRAAAHFEYTSRSPDGRVRRQHLSVA